MTLMNDTEHIGGGVSPLLERIKRPSDLKSFSDEEIRQLPEALRHTIISTTAANGGHLAPHLGVVELALALHVAFDAEKDKIIWDVGHQCYPHKLLTGRAASFSSIRKQGGLSGYPKPDESPYDAFGVGHSSTSISAALGMAVARDLRGTDERVVAVIGDGAITGGMAFEALAHAGHVGTDMLVILNDNRMSISRNVGALSSYFNRLITAGIYNRARQDISSLMRQVLGPSLSKAAQRVEQGVKGILTPSTIFEELGWKYVGPVDGHDLDTLIDFFRNLTRFRGPVFFHCVTQKGKGYEYAEVDPLTYHGVRAFDIDTGKFVPAASSARSFTDVFADALIEAARDDDRVIAITAAMPTGTGLSKFEQHFPDRTFDVGICEQHAVTFAAGLASQGMKPVCAIYSTFLQRGYDQLIHDVCIQRLPVVFAIDRAGAVGEDSPTQQGAFDLSFLRVIPELTLLVPRDDVDLRGMLLWALRQQRPVAIRYARGLAPTLGPAENRDITCGEVLREGSDLTLLGVGPCLLNAMEAAEKLASRGISAAVVDARIVKPLDTSLLDSLAGRPIITLEENTILGGFGSAVLEYLASREQPADLHLRMLGFPDAFLGHATREEQMVEIHLDTESIVQAARELVGLTTSHPAGTA